jgi:hypothetical protein
LGAEADDHPTPELLRSAPPQSAATVVAGRRAELAQIWARPIDDWGGLAQDPRALRWLVSPRGCHLVQSKGRSRTCLRLLTFWHMFFVCSRAYLSPTVPVGLGRDRASR